MARGHSRAASSCWPADCSYLIGKLVRRNVSVSAGFDNMAALLTYASLCLPRAEMHCLLRSKPGVMFPGNDQRLCARSDQKERACPETEADLCAGCGEVQF